MTTQAITEIVGFGSLEQIADLKSRYKPKKIMLVTGRGSYSACGAKAIIDQNFTSDEYVQFSDFEINPKLSDALRGVEIARENNIDLILAIGGGSVIDIAKLVKALFNADPTSAEAIARGEMAMDDPDIPLVAVPTTAGSGSEATHFAVVYIGKDKFSLADQALLPNMTILDGKLLQSASPYQKAINGLDALAQSIEGSWAVGSTSESQGYGLKGVELLMSHLPAILTANNEDDLQKVMLASNLAGKTINISKTTAAHAFSYAFTGYHDVPHGHAVWLTLPEIFAIHLEGSCETVNDPRGKEHVSSTMTTLADLLGIKSTATAAGDLREFMVKIGVEPDMQKMGAVTNEQRSFIPLQVNLQRLGNNPVMLGDKELTRIFKLA